MYTITLADGQKIENLDKNGDNFVSKTKVDESIFENNLTKVTVSDGETTETYRNVEFIQQMPWSDGTYYLAFRVVDGTEKSITDIEMALVDVYEMLLGGTN